MISKEQLVQITESSIDSLVTRFKKTSYFFYTENDLHAFLYSDIYNRLPDGEWLCRTSDNRSSVLLHKEYPTKERYNARALKDSVTKGARGHFDLSIWNPEETSNRVFRVDSFSNFKDEQQTFIAIEFDLIEGNRTLESALHHFKWDLLKLSGTNNEVEHGFQIVFVRNWVYRNDFLAETRADAAKTGNTIVLYIETNNDTCQAGTLSPKPFLNYKPIFH